jgi:hypothetical protein
MPPRLELPDYTAIFGEKGDIPIVGDWDGDKSTTIGTFGPTSGLFVVRNLNTTGVAHIMVTYGSPGDLPVVGRWE